MFAAHSVKLSSNAVLSIPERSRFVDDTAETLHMWCMLRSTAGNTITSIITALHLAPRSPAVTMYQAGYEVTRQQSIAAYDKT